MTTLAHSFLIESSSFLKITRIYMKAWMSSNFGQIPPPATELSALERLAGNEDNHKVLVRNLTRSDHGLQS